MYVCMYYFKTHNALHTYIHPLADALKKPALPEVAPKPRKKKLYWKVRQSVIASVIGTTLCMYVCMAGLGC